MMNSALVAQMVIRALSGMGWHVHGREEDVSNSVRHDIVATDPNGRIFLIEVKGGDEPMHFATIAQLEKAAHLLSSQEGRAVTPVLLTSQNVRSSLLELADEVGVRVVEASGSDQEAVESVVQFLRATQ